MMKQYVLLLAIFSSILCFSQSANDLVPKGKSFYIQSAMTYGKNNLAYWDIPGGPKDVREGVKIQAWELKDKVSDRRYRFEKSSNAGYVKIYLEGVDGCLDVSGGSKKNGTEIIVFKPHTGWNQDYSLKYLGAGKFKILSSSGKVLLLNGRKIDNGTKIVTWDDHEGAFTEWYLIDAATNQPLNFDNARGGDANTEFCTMPTAGNFFIQSALNYGNTADGFFDVPGIKEPKAGNLLQMYALTDFLPDRKFTITQSSSSLSQYHIAIADDKVICMEGRESVIQLNNESQNTNQNFSFKHLGGGKFKIVGAGGKVIALKGGTSTNETQVVLENDNDSRANEWYFISSATGELVLPSNESGGSGKTVVEGSGVTQTASASPSIDEMLKTLRENKVQCSKTLVELHSSYSSVSGTVAMVNEYGSLTGRVTDTKDALSAFTKVPYIGIAARGLQTGLEFSLKGIEKVQVALEVPNKTTLPRMHDDIHGAIVNTLLLTSRIQLLENQLNEMKIQLSAEKLAANADALKNISTRVKNALSSTANNHKQIREKSKEISKLDKPVDDVNAGLKKFNTVFKKTDRIADDINDVLDKRFKKKVLGVKVNISVRDVLEGGKVGKAIEKVVKPWADELLEPIMDRLKSKMPEIPGVEKVKKQIDESSDFSKSVRTNSDEFPKATTELKSVGEELNMMGN